MNVFRSRLQELGFANYEAYLASELWSDFKARYKRSGRSFKCAVCCGRKKLQFHHRTYDRLGAEVLDDIVILCWFHHEQVHDWLNRNVKPVEATREAIFALQNPTVRAGVTKRQAFAAANLLAKLKKRCRKAGESARHLLADAEEMARTGNLQGLSRKLSDVAKIRKALSKKAEPPPRIEMKRPHPKGVPAISVDAAAQFEAVRVEQRKQANLDLSRHQEAKHEQHGRRKKLPKYVQVGWRDIPDDASEHAAWCEEFYATKIAWMTGHDRLAEAQALVAACECRLLVALYREMLHKKKPEPLPADQLARLVAKKKKPRKISNGNKGWVKPDDHTTAYDPFVPVKKRRRS